MNWYEWVGWYLLIGAVIYGFLASFYIDEVAEMSFLAGRAEYIIHVMFWPLYVIVFLVLVPFFTIYRFWLRWSKPHA